jgi:signal transduction histidine kinase
VPDRVVVVDDHHFRHFEPSFAEARADEILLPSTMPSDTLTGKLLGLLAHDLRTPLSSVLLHLELLEGAGLTSEAREDLAYALASARALTEMIDVAVDAIRGVEPVMEEHDLAAIVRQAGERPPGVASRGPIEVDGPDALGVRCDHRLTLRVVEQMVSSARAVTPSDRAVKVKLSADTQRGRVEVVDEGVAIPAELREQFFDAAGAVAIRAEHRGLSRGIGPVFCRRVARAQGGEAGVDQHPEGPEARGNAFWIEVPLGKAGPAS